MMYQDILSIRHLTLSAALVVVFRRIAPNTRINRCYKYGTYDEELNTHRAA